MKTDRIGPAPATLCGMVVGSGISIHDYAGHDNRRVIAFATATAFLIKPLAPAWPKDPGILESLKEIAVTES